MLKVGILTEIEFCGVGRVRCEMSCGVSAISAEEGAKGPLLALDDFIVECAEVSMF